MNMRQDTEPTTILRRSEDRGRASFGWLESQHTFSFGSYYDPDHMGFSDLRVINDDRVAPGGGFAAHGHRNMEIISYVLEGGLAHRDSTGAGGVVHPGQVQLMSAGRGIQHSEMNGSQTDPVHFLQIWVVPAETGTEPRYEDRHFAPTPGLTLLASPDGREGSLQIGQDTDLYRALLDEGSTVELVPRLPNAWIHVVRGEVRVNDVVLRAGDGLGVRHRQGLTLTANEEAEVLLFELR